MKSKNQLLSVILCTYNRSDSLKDTLESLSIQECNRDYSYEVIVIDNNSTDDTKETVRSYKLKFDGKLRYVFEPNQGLSNARNRGIKESNGDIIIFTDDDVILDENWLVNIWQCFNAYNCDAVGGRILPLYPSKTSSWVWDNEHLLRGPIVLYDYGQGTKPHDNKTMMPFVGASMAFRRDCFDRLGLFRSDIGAGKGTIGEDSEFFRRLENRNLKLYYCGKALALHKVERKRMSYTYIAKWHVSSGKYFIRKKDMDKNLVYYFGIPRYLFKELPKDFLLLIVTIFNRRKFLLNLIRTSTKIGQCLEYRKKGRISYVKS